MWNTVPKAFASQRDRSVNQDRNKGREEGLAGNDQHRSLKNVYSCIL
jgi:hypothetical protein